MARNKWIYHHFVNNKEVTKEEFIKVLEQYCYKCDTNFDNPCLNISYLDTHLLKRKYDYFKCHPHHATIYVEDNITLCIRREPKQ